MKFEKEKQFFLNIRLLFELGLQLYKHNVILLAFERKKNEIV